MSRFYYSPFIMGAVPGMLTSYDLPDLAASLAPRPLMMIGTTNGNNEARGVEEDMSFIRDTYGQRQAAGRLVIAPSVADEDVHSLFERWSR